MNKWIKVTEKLPEEKMQAKLVWLKNLYCIGTYGIAFIGSNGVWHEWMSDKPMSEFGYMVVAWQELPDTFKE